MRSRLHQALVALLALGTGGCELVFGLDDYARGPGAGTGVSSSGASANGASASGASAGGTSAGGGGGGGDDATGGSPGSASSTASGAATATSTGTGPPAGCQCLPEVPDGWTAVVRRETDLAVPEADCLGVERAVVGPPRADCTCSCSDTAFTCDGEALRCWAEDGCTGSMESWSDLTGSCREIGQRRSCDVVPATPSGPSCAPGGTPAAPTGDAVDLCPASSETAPGCAGSGLCSELLMGERLCVRGEGPCPDGWTNQELELHELGAFTCEDCGCSERACSSPQFLLSTGEASCVGGAGVRVEGECEGTVYFSFVTTVARVAQSPVPEGDCTPLTETVEARYEPGTPSRLCCLSEP